MKNCFTTKFGDDIELLPNVEDHIYYNSTRTLEEYREILSRDCTEIRRNDRLGKPVRIRPIIGDLYHYSILIDLLKELDLIPKDAFDTALDIGGAEGIHAALFRAQFSRSSHVADVLDGRDPELPNKLMTQLWETYRKYRRIELLRHQDSEGARALEGYLRDSLNDDSYRGKRVPRVDHERTLNVPTFQSYYDMAFKREPKVDEFIIGDWKTTVTGKYDIIINFLCFWLWQRGEAFRKISESLNDGGLFAMNAPYFWISRPSGDDSGYLGGQFPYFEQRLVLEDIVRYYELYKPHLLPIVEDVYNTFDTPRPTVRDYIEAAMDAGLVLRGYRRLYNRQKYALVSKSRFGDRVLVDETYGTPNPGGKVIVDLDEVLQNIHRFRPDVQFEDLITRNVVMVFQKAL